MPSYTGRYSPRRVTSDKEWPLKHAFERTQGPKPKVYFPASSVSKQQIKPGNTYLHSNFCLHVRVRARARPSLSPAFMLPSLCFVNPFIYNSERAPGGKLEPEVCCAEQWVGGNFTKRQKNTTLSHKTLCQYCNNFTVRSFTLAKDGTSSRSAQHYSDAANMSSRANAGVFLVRLFCGRVRLHWATITGSLWRHS